MNYQLTVLKFGLDELKALGQIKGYKAYSLSGGGVSLSSPITVVCVHFNPEVVVYATLPFLSVFGEGLPYLSDSLDCDIEDKLNGASYSEYGNWPEPKQ